MKKILTAAVSATMFLFVAGGAAIAQDEEADEMRTVPVETSPPSIQPVKAKTRVAFSTRGALRMWRSSLGDSFMRTFYWIA